MPKYVNDEQIIEAWTRFGSAAKVAKALKINIRQIYFRRRIIEKKLGIAMPSTSSRPTKGPTIDKAKALFQNPPEPHQGPANLVNNLP